MIPKPRFWSAVFTLFGTIVGAGIFALPYTIAKAGLWPSLFFFVFITVLAVLLHLMYGEVVLRTPGKHRLPGYARLYLGAGWRWLAALSDLAGGYLILVVYLILGAQFLAMLAPSLNQSWAAIWFWLFFSVIMALGLKQVGKTELVLNLILIVFLLFILYLGSGHWNFFNVNSFGSGKDIFLPYGVLVFALTGAIAVPEMRDLLLGRESAVKKTIVWGTLLAAAVSFLFGFAVAGITGQATTQNALGSLAAVVGSVAAKAGAVVGLIAVGTSYLIGSLYSRDLLAFDFRWPKIFATGLTFILPLALFKLGLQSFVSLIGFVGAVFVAFSFVVTLLLYRAARQKGLREPEYKLAIPAWLVWVLAVLFGAGAITELLL